MILGIGSQESIPNLFYRSWKVQKKRFGEAIHSPKRKVFSIKEFL